MHTLYNGNRNPTGTSVVYSRRPHLLHGKLKDTTCMIVSHDTKFLDKTVSQMIHFDNLKLHNYRGNVTDFVARFPWAKSYFELKSSTITFKFPTPAVLMGAKGKPVKRATPILSMKEVAFTYVTVTSQGGREGRKHQPHFTNNAACPFLTAGTRLLGDGVRAVVPGRRCRSSIVCIFDFVFIFMHLI